MMPDAVSKMTVEYSVPSHTAMRENAPRSYSREEYSHLFDPKLANLKIHLI